MNKTININLAGIIFHLDEPAYEAFKSYLSQVKNALEDQESGAEVIADIEARIAEIFSMRLAEYKREVINALDISFVISTLGRPEDFQDDEDAAFSQQQHSSSTSKTKKRLYRNPDERFIGGVASGIAAYFGTDTVWIRLIFLVLLFFTGIGFLTYIILWAAIPEAKTTAQKLQMRGEPVNLSNIEKSVKEELDGVKERFGRFREENKGAGNKIGDGIQSFFAFLLMLLETVFTFIFKFIGIILVIIGILFGSFLLLGMLGVVATTWNIGGMDYLTFDGAVLGLNGLEAVIGNGWTLNLLRAGALLTLLLPLFGLISLIARAFGKPLANGRILNIAGGASFIVGLALLIYSGLRIGEGFKVSATEMTTTTLEGNQFDLRADLIHDNDAFLFEVDEDHLQIENVRLNIKKTFDSTATLVLKHRARGKNNSAARLRAQNFNYPIEQTGTVVTFNEYFSVPREALYRAQELRGTLYLPVGAEIFLDPSVENVIYDIENFHNMLDRNMIGHTWRMERKGLVCLDCQEIDYYSNEDLNEIDEAIDQVEDGLEDLEDDISEEIERLELELKRLKNK